MVCVVYVAKVNEPYLNGRGQLIIMQNIIIKIMRMI